MRKTGVMFLMVLFAVNTTIAIAGERVPLFDGKSLDGWELLKCEAKVDGGEILLVSGNGMVQTAGKYGDFVLEFDWKALAEDKWDSGVYFRYDSIPEGRPWPPMYQVNLRKGMEGNVGKVEGATSEGLVKDGEWNTFKLTVKGGKIDLQINGQQAWKGDGLQGPVVLWCVFTCNGKSHHDTGVCAPPPSTRPSTSSCNPSVTRLASPRLASLSAPSPPWKPGTPFYSGSRLFCVPLSPPLLSPSDPASRLLRPLAQATGSP